MNINDTHFRKVLESFSPLPDEEFRRFADVMHERQVHKKEVLLKEGQICREFYFILNGCIRSFRLENGKEVNLRFYFEDDFAANFESFRNGEPSKFYLEAMEDSMVYCGIKTEVIPVMQNHISFYSFAFRFFQIQYFREAKHANTFKLMSPEERYQFILEHKPHYLQRIPLNALASYLGISRETLSRIRKKIR